MARFKGRGLFAFTRPGDADGQAFARVFPTDNFQGTWILALSVCASPPFSRYHQRRMIDLDQLRPERLRPLRRAEYDRLIEIGAFDEEERVELLYGMLVAMSPQYPPHAEGISRLAEVLLPALRGRARVRVQLPLALSDDSEPEPDLAVVPPQDYAAAHPATAFLVVEVAGATARKDRGLKAQLYAEAGIPEYWVVDLAHAVVVVHRQPAGANYTLVTEHREGELGLERFPDVAVRVLDLVGGLPPNA